MGAENIETNQVPTSRWFLSANLLTLEQVFSEFLYNKHKVSTRREREEGRTGENKVKAS